MLSAILPFLLLAEIRNQFKAQWPNMSDRTLKTAPTQTIAATTAKTVSMVPTVRAAGAGRDGAGAGAFAGTGAAGRDTAVPGRTAAGAAGAGRGACVAGAAAPAGRGAAGAPGAGAAAPAGAAPAGGNDGNLIVGADVGFGGRAMRTVSFLGWTLAASGGLGGKPLGGFVGESGVGSAIKSCGDKLGARKNSVKCERGCGANSKHQTPTGVPPFGI